MRIYVATDPLELEDFTCLEGEPVLWPQICDNPDSCGCRWQVVGLGSEGRSSTFTVADVDVDVSTYRDMLVQALYRAGWDSLDERHDADLAAWISEAADHEPGHLLRWWDDHPVPDDEFCHCDRDEDDE